jgi:hypothetical protein
MDKRQPGEEIIYGFVLVDKYPPLNLERELWPTAKSIKAAAAVANSCLKTVEVHVEHKPAPPGQSYGRVLKVSGENGVLAVTIQLTAMGVRAAACREYLSGEYLADTDARTGEPTTILTAVALVKRPGLRNTAWAKVVGNATPFEPNMAARQRPFAVSASAVEVDTRGGKGGPAPPARLVFASAECFQRACPGTRVCMTYMRLF